MIYGVIEYNYTVPLTQQFESLIYFHGLLLTLAYLNPTDSDVMVSFNAVTVGNHARPVTMRVTRDFESVRVSGVSIVSTLCSDSH